MRVIIYVRVSTADQSVERQVEELVEFASSQKWNVVKIIREVGSGSITIDKRQSITELKTALDELRVQKVLVSEISRLGRTTSESLSLVDYMTSKKISCFEFQRRIETLNPDGTTNAIAELILSVLASVAKMEKAQLVQRIKSGMESARRRNIHCGRPLGSKKGEEAIASEYRLIVRSLETEQLSLRKTAKLYSVSPATVQKIKRLVRK